MRIQRLLYAGLGLLFLSQTACKKEFLNIDPIDRYSFYSFPKNESQVDQAVVANYRQMFVIHNSFLWVFGDMMSDNTSFRYNPNDRGGVNTEQLDEFVAIAQEGTLTNMYRDSYEGIMRSNYAMAALPGIDYVSDSLKSIREGELSFFRAWHYFNLVRLYVDVSIITTVETEPNPNVTTTFPRRPVAEVYTQILSDVQNAINRLPATVPVSQRGRLTRPAALMLQAKIQMTQRRFAEAITTLNSITGYTLNPSYVNNFDPRFKNGPESILEIQTNASTTLGYTFGWMGSWTPWGTGTTVWANGSNSRGGLNQPTADLINAFEPNDLRRNVIVGTVTVGTTVIPYMNKFRYFDTASKLNPVQFPMYRFADVMLMQAECLNEASFPSTQAFILLNAVRSRAGLPAKTQGNANPLLAVNTQEEFRLAIERERQVEFAGEAHRWFDLVRTNRATAVMTAHGQRERALKTTLDPNAYSNIKLLVGIPFREVQQFGFPQNPGW